MKSVAKIIKSCNVETPVVSAMFIGYFVLLVFSTTFLINEAQQSEGTNSTASETKTEMNIQVQN